MDADDFRFRSCQGSLAISRLSRFSPEEERVAVMGHLNEDGWLRYLENFQQTNEDLVAFLRLPTLSERVRDRIASKIYNFPLDKPNYDQQRRSPGKDLLEKLSLYQGPPHQALPMPYEGDVELGLSR